MRAGEATSIASYKENLSPLLKNKEIPSLPLIPPSTSNWEENFRDQVPLIDFSTWTVATTYVPLPVTTTMYQCLKDTGREGDWQSFAAFPIVTWQGRQNLVHEPLPYEMFKDLKYKGQWAPIPASLCARAQPSPDLMPGAGPGPPGPPAPSSRRKTGAYSTSGRGVPARSSLR